MRTLSILLLVQLAGPAQAEGRKLLEACHRGSLHVCTEMLARPRLAAGTRAAIELFLEDVAGKRLSCDAGDANICDALRRDHPDLQ